MSGALVDRDPGDEAPSVRDLDIVNWRFSELCDAGYPVDVATMLAERADVDLHTARGLLRRGATVAQAVRILV